MNDPNFITPPNAQFSPVKREDETNLSRSLSKLTITNFNNNNCSISVHDVIKPVYTVLSKIFLWPYKYSDGNQILPLTTTHKLCCYVFSALYTLTFLCEMYLRVPLFQIGSNIATWLMEAIFRVSAHVLVVLSILLTNSKYGDSTKSFYLKAEGIRRRYWIAERSFFDGLRRKVSQQLKIVFVTGTLGILADYALYSYASDLTFLTVYSSLYVSMYFFVFILIQINNKLDILLAYYCKLNEQLRKFKASDPSGIRGVYDVIEIYNRLCDMVTIYNRAHGWQFLMILVSFVSMILGMLVAGVTIKIDHLRGGNVIVIFGVTIVADILATTFYFVLIMKIIMNCSGTAREASKSGLIANKVLIRLKRRNSDKSKCEELKTLIDQVNYRNPRFSAGGIFSVDMTAVSGMFGAVTSYFIILLQFRDKPMCDCSKNFTADNQFMKQY